jgi:hypothetical protein
MALTRPAGGGRIVRIVLERTMDAVAIQQPIEPQILYQSPTFERHVGHGFDNAKAIDPESYPDLQIFLGKVVVLLHELEFTTVAGLRFDEIVAPDMVAMPRP